jgi:general secretion pathway protein F
MPDYHYNAIDRGGQGISGVITADDHRSAIATLADRGVFVTDIDQRRTLAERKLTAPWEILRRRRISRRVRAAMLQQLATALQAGLALLPALRVVEEQAENDAMRSLMGDLAERVQSGESLSAALSAHPREFSALEVSMTRVGETAGLLDQVMGYLAEFAQREVETRQQIRSAATYPAFVLVLASISVVIILTVILPRVLGGVRDAVPVLPLPTVIMMGLGDLIRSYGWLLIVLLIAGVWGFRAWRGSEKGRLAFDRFILRVPVLGTALRRIAVGRFARTLGTLSRAGIGILEALRVLRNTLGNEAMARQIDRVAAEIREGQSIADPLRGTGQFPPLLIQVIAMGESTGRLDELLLQTASAYEKETAAAIHRVMTILPAIFTVLLALVVLFVLAAVLLPIVSMQTSLPGM